MRIAIGEFAHETNTFCPGLTEIGDFRLRNWSLGDDIIPRHRGVRNDIGGMIDAAARLGNIELVPLLATSTQPSATVSRAAYDEIGTPVRPNQGAASWMRSAWRCTARDRPSTPRTWKAPPSELGALVGRIFRWCCPGTARQLDRAMMRHCEGDFYCHEYPHTNAMTRVKEPGNGGEDLQWRGEPLKHCSGGPSPSRIHLLRGDRRVITSAAIGGSAERGAGLQLHPRVPRTPTCP